MSNKPLIRILLPALILSGFCVFVIRLFLQHTIGLYIHPRYSLFAASMAVIALVLLIVGLVAEIRTRPQVIGKRRTTVRFVDCVVVVVLALALILPAHALSTRAANQTELVTPAYIADDSDNDICSDSNPATFQQWVLDLGEAPSDCYTGQTLDLTGMVMDDLNNTLPYKTFYFGRLVVSCCIVDARPYALPVSTGRFVAYPTGTWLRIKGTVQVMSEGGQVSAVIQPLDITPLQQPKQPYEYSGVAP